MSLVTKSRFAPSPTGILHLGNVRTALFSYLLGKHLKGEFILRCEDTDQERSKEAYLQQQQIDLKWLGLDWDAGPDMGSERGPYRQSQRSEIYNKYYQELQDAELAYPCFCTPQELKLLRKAQLQSGQPPRYNGKCSHLSAEEVAQHYAQGDRASLRFKVPKDENLVIQDSVVGEKKYLSNDIGDFIIRRSDGTPAFFFCNAIDDSLMGVTHVLRGVDHLTNTPRQLMLLTALNLRAPEYGHISLVVGQDGGPLSKRDGSTGVKDLREQGYLSGAILNHLARLGHNYTNTNYMSLQELAEEFGLENCGKSPSKHDPVQLMHWQKEAILKASTDELGEWAKPWLEKSAPYTGLSDARQNEFLQLIRDNIELPQEAVAWADKLLAESKDEDAAEYIRNAPKSLFETLLDALEDASLSHFGKLLKDVGKDLGVKGKALFMPIRSAISGATHGPQMQALADFLGKDELLKRLHNAVEDASA